MFVKAIRFKDVLVGDVACEYHGDNHRVETSGVSTLVFDDRDVILNTCALSDMGKSTLVGHPDKFIGLLHRPRPEGKTEADMKRTALGLARHVLAASDEAQDAAMVELREALEAWELGKPPETR